MCKLRRGRLAAAARYGRRTRPRIFPDNRRSRPSDRSVACRQADRRTPLRALGHRWPSNAMATPCSSADIASISLAMAARRVRRSPPLASSRLSSGASAFTQEPRSASRASSSCCGLSARRGARHGAAKSSRRVRACRSSPRNCAKSSRESVAARRRPRAAQQRKLQHLDAARQSRQRARRAGTADASAAPAGSAAPVRCTPPRRPAARKFPPACPSARRRRNRRMRDSSGRAPPSPAAPARGPASPAPRSCSGARASRIATAIASASISGLAAAITARLVHAGCDLLGDLRTRASRACHCAVAFDGRIASDTSTSRPHGAGAPSVSTSPRVMPNRVEQRVHRELRMVRRRAAS